MGCGNTSAHPHHDAGSAVIQLRVPNIPAPFSNCSVATMAALLDGINEACCAHQDCSADGFKLGYVYFAYTCERMPDIARVHRPHDCKYKYMTSLVDDTHIRI